MFVVTRTITFSLATPQSVGFYLLFVAGRHIWGLRVLVEEHFDPTCNTLVMFLCAVLSNVLHS